ncbi:MAG: Uncharacterized protein K0R34_2156 [Herbinix sp.]|jgi:hypothetical protein|nr:Uncharacterized protein [Herbinix sp.]
MAKIYAPNKQYSGISASVAFAKGVGETDNPTLLDWFRDHGYEVEEIQDENTQDPPKDPPKEPGKFDGMDVEQLKAYAAENKIEIGNSTSVNGILKKIMDAEKKGE